jgi:hypothetical protein
MCVLLLYMPWLAKKTIGTREQIPQAMNTVSVKWNHTQQHLAEQCVVSWLGGAEVNRGRPTFKTRRWITEAQQHSRSNTSATNKSRFEKTDVVQ